MLTGVAGAFSSAAASIRLFSASSLTTNTRPAAPSLVATAVSVSQINLSWNPVSGASGYLVEELSNGVWSQIGNAYSGVRVYAVGGLSAGTTYSFEVGAYNLAGVSWSRFQTATTAAATAGEPAAATAYTAVSGALFAANGPDYLDVHQGNLGDCWLMASLAEVAARDPADIVSMFTAEGTTVENGAVVGLYRVRFFNSNGVAEYVTVNTELPSGGAYYDQVQNGILWAALAEKAYAEANGEGIVTSGAFGSDSYGALNGGNPCWALQAITGKSASGVEQQSHQRRRRLERGPTRRPLHESQRKRQPYRRRLRRDPRLRHGQVRPVQQQPVRAVQSLGDQRRGRGAGALQRPRGLRRPVLHQRNRNLK